MTLNADGKGHQHLVEPDMNVLCALRTVALNPTVEVQHSVLIESGHYMWCYHCQFLDLLELLRMGRMVSETSCIFMARMNPSASSKKAT